MSGTGRTISRWGNEIATEVVRGHTFRVYTERPRDVAEVLDFAPRWGDRAHVVQGDTVVTFAALHRAVAAKAAELGRAGLGRGGRVLILGFNSPEWIVNFWACVRLGSIPVLGNAWWGGGELTDALAGLRPAMVLADRRASAGLPSGAPQGPWACDLSGDGAEQLPDPPGGADEDAPAAIVYTSGTAGRAKAVVLSHRALLAGLHQLLHVTRRLPHQVDEKAGDAGLHTGPMFHIGGVQTLLRAVTVGDTLVMPAGKFDPAEALHLIEAWRIARWSAVPTMVTRVMEHPDAQTRDLTSLRSVTVGGAPVNAEFLAALRAGLPGVEPRVATGYGLTENGGQATAASGRDTAARPGSSGRALPLVELSSTGGDGLVDGELLVRSPTQMSEYLGESDSPVDPDGWLHTGDLAHVDDDGHLWITGRAKDMIIRGGENIAPAAVEAALSRVPGVVESAVFGVPHPDLGEEVMAAVVVEDGTTSEAIREHLRAHLASFAIPSRWRLEREPLPTTHSGKIDKKAVAADAVRELAATPGARP